MASAAAALQLDPAAIDAVSLPARVDEFAREVYGFLGVPLDVTSMKGMVGHIEKAAASATPLLLATTNVNFLVTSRRDSEFRQSLISSDICTADGMPVVWLGRLLGIPMKERVAGSDLFDLLKYKRPNEPLKVFLFGGAKGVAETAAAKTQRAKRRGHLHRRALSRLRQRRRYEHGFDHRRDQRQQRGYPRGGVKCAKGASVAAEKP